MKTGSQCQPCQLSVDSPLLKCPKRRAASHSFSFRTSSPWLYIKHLSLMATCEAQHTDPSHPLMLRTGTNAPVLLIAWHNVVWLDQSHFVYYPKLFTICKSNKATNVLRTINRSTQSSRPVTYTKVLWKSNKWKDDLWLVCGAVWH